MKFISKRFLLSLVITAAIFPNSISQSYAGVISDRGQLAIEQIATCINSDGKDLLNVMYLIDESASLRSNDPTNLRVQGLTKSLEQFRDVTTTKPYFTVNRAFTTFGDKFTVRKSWEKLSNDKLEDDIEWINSNIPKLNQGRSTDWNLGLKGVLNEFSKVQSLNSCNVLVWFTDGGVQVLNDSLTRNSMIEICGFDPVTGQKTGNQALIDKFRNTGINIQGVLLRNQAYIDDPVGFTNGDYTKEEADIEIARMSYFLPVVEQAGGVSNGAFVKDGPDKFNCGSFTGAGGVLQTVSDPLDIIWPPVQFSCLANNGRVIPIEKGKIKIDAALTRFSVTVPAKNFFLKNSEGETIATDQGPAKGDVVGKYINSSKSIVEISGKIDSVNQITKPGVWSISSADLERAVFCGYLDIGIEVKVGTCYTGEVCNYTGQFTRFGKAVDLDNFQSVKASSALIDEQGSAGTYTPLAIDPGDSTFAGSFTSAGANRIANLKIALKVVTKTGIEFSLGTIKPIAVIPPGLYPEITPSPITKSDFSANLVGKNGRAEASLTINAPTRTNGQVCLSSLEVRSDVNPNRIKGYVSSLAGQDLKANPCFTLLTGSSGVFKFEVTNNQAAEGVVSGYLPAILKADGQPDIKTKIDVQFESSILIDKGKFAVLFPLLMFLGIALPLAMLSYINSRNSRLVLDNIYRASIPVILSASGNFVSVERAEKLKSSELLSHEDFLPFSSGKEIVRSKQIGSEILSGHAPKNPFGNLQAKITAPLGQVITASAFTVGKNKFPINQAQGALNPSGLIYVTLNEASNEILKKQNLDSDENNQKVEGNLTALLSLNTGDPVAQVDYLNTKIMHEGGWLDHLLKLETVSKAQTSSKKLRSKKNQGKDHLVVSAEIADDWDNAVTGTGENPTKPDKSSGNSSPKIGSASGDDWGTPSAPSDWDTPGTYNNPGSKEEW